MKKRTNIYLDEADKAWLDLIKKHYNLSSDAAAVRLAIKQVAEEIARHVSGTPYEHRQDGSTR